ncbi:MAG: hypothetical protein Q9227_001501 [Pyrenula ochraceoflavens]
MRYSVAVALAACLSQTSAHGVITQIQGANGVNMPGLSVADGTPRDCASPGCGSEADTSIIRTKEMGTNKASALGRTNGNGAVDANAAVAKFMGTSTGSAAGSSASGSTASTKATNKRGLADLLGGGAGKGAGGAGGAAGAAGGAGGAAASSDGTKTPKGTTEDGVSKAAGTGATSGMPTCADDGTITMTFHQVNQDGAGPLTAAVDGTSGGTDPNAFQDAQVMQDVPGIGIGGLSAAQTTDFPVKVQMPQGMTCDATVGGVANTCVVRMQNSALAGPFGGSAAFQQSAGAKKRALEYRLKARGLHVARGLVGKADAE